MPAPLREQVVLLCGCIFYRDHHEPNKVTVEVEPCETHEPITRLSARDKRRYLDQQWPPNSYSVQRALLRVS